MRLNQSFKTWAESAKEIKLSEIKQFKKASDFFFFFWRLAPINFCSSKRNSQSQRRDGTSGSLCFDNVLVLI